MLFHGVTGNCVNITFRPFQQGDMASFRNCIEDFYKDGYPYKEYLDESFLKEKLDAGKMFLLCGVTKENEIVSTSAVRFDTEFPGSGLLLLRVVKGAYQGMGIGSAQENHLLEWIRARKKQIRSLYADVMTHNEISQGSLARRGFVLCGIRLMLYKPEIMVSDLSFSKGGRLSQAVMCKNDDMKEAGDIYCAAEHEKAVSRIYGALGAAVTIDTEETAPVFEKTEQTRHEDRQHHCQIWMVQAVGKDFEHFVDNAMQKSCEFEDTTILCYLNMKDRGSIFAYERLREKGFFFTGIKPLQTDREYMLLSHIGDRAIRQEDIHLYQGGTDLLSYIERHRSQQKGEGN